MRRCALALVTLLAGAAPVGAAPVSGETTTFEAEGGVIEECIRLQDFPDAHYGGHDRKEEAEFCALDFSRLALCPKLWSTSPGTIVYEIDLAAWGGDTAAFERQHCAGGHHARAAALGKPAVFKISVNDRETSATYAPSSWVYYHLSRYFRTHAHVPVAVYRSMDKATHHRRVVQPALSIVAERHGLKMLAAGWRVLDRIESGEADATANHAALTDDGRQVYGVLLDNDGDRYGTEFNGTRESGWGNGQNFDFQQTAPFLALRDPAPIREAAKSAIHEARGNPRMAKDLRADTPVEQVVFWMQDVIEITLMDFILGQQDRIGNIDYTWRWYWVEDGKLHSRSAHGNEPPPDIAGHEPLRLRRSAINDNDAGVRTGYADFAERTHMLEGLRHYNPELYVRLGRLAADLQAQGPAHAWLRETAGLGEREVANIARRADAAFNMLQADCRSGALALDLEPASVLPGGPPVTGKASCEVPAE